ncbi:MAG: hypothetical protein ABL952_10685 [Pyrinomonadaceae bacterium]
MSFSTTDEKVGAYVRQYLLESGYSSDGYADHRFRVSVGPLVLNFPNPGRLPYHDLHHVVSGYGTGLIGEAEESIYELRGGCPTILILFLCLGSIAIGCFLSPKRIIKAWRATKGTSTLYASPIPYETLLEMNMIDLRRSLNIAPGGIGTGAEKEGEDRL